MNTTEKTHTAPTEMWTAKTQQLPHGELVQIIDNDSGYIVATLDSDTNLTKHENAAIILKAVNCHGELVTACVESLAALKSGYIQERANATELILKALKSANSNQPI